MLGIARRESPGHGKCQEMRTTTTEELPGKAKLQDRRIARGNAKEKRANLGLINGASDSVGNHVGTGENQ